MIKSDGQILIEAMIGGAGGGTTYERRLETTRFIIRNYRILNAHCKFSDCDFEQSGGGGVDLSQILGSDIALCSQRTESIMAHIKISLQAYKGICEKSKKPERARRWRVLSAAYLADQGLSADEISEKECIDRRTVFKDISKSIKDLTALIFGIDGI